MLEGLEQACPVQLVSTAAAEDPPDQGGGGDQVRDLPRIRAERPVDGRVLAGHLQRVELGLVDVLVDAGDVVERVLLQLCALGAVDDVAQIELALELGLVVGRDRPLRAVELAVAGRAADERRELGAAEMAQDVDEEEAVLGRGVAEAELGAGAGGAVDVRHAELRVAHDRDVVARALGALDVARPHAEGGVLVVAGNVGLADVRRAEDEVGVHVALVGVVRRPRGVVPLERGQLHRVDEAVRTGGKDVAEPREVVGPVGLWRRSRGRRSGVDRQQGKPRHDDRPDAKHGVRLLLVASGAHSTDLRSVYAPVAPSRS